jgi:DNA repair photolyase
MDDTILDFWEPGAPDFKERLACLKHAYRKGFRTSVNIEPMLDVPNVVKLFRQLTPYVNVFINIGMMERVGPNVQPKTQREKAAVRRIEENQTDDKIREIYQALKDEPLARWGRSISKVLGLRRPKKCG